LTVKRYRLLIGAGVSLLLLFLVIRNIEVGKIALALRGAGYSYLLLANLVRLGAFGLRAVRWKYLLRPVKDLRARILLPRILIGYFGNYFLPAQSGEVLRAFALARGESLQTSTVLATIIVERMLDTLILLFGLLVLLCLFPLPDWIRYVGGLAGLLFAIGLLLLASWHYREKDITHLLTTGLAKISSSLASRVKNLLASFSRGMLILREGRGMTLSALLSFSAWSLMMATLVLTGASLGISLTGYVYVLLLVIFNLASLVPALPGKVGTLEFVFAGILAAFSADRSDALAFALLFRATHILPLALGYFYLWREGFELIERAGASQEANAIS
jgi:hypothetical protein